MNSVKPTIAATAPHPVSPWRGTVAGFSASLVGIGLARFAYTPLLPAIVDAHWFDASKAAYLGAANLAGYLAGALFGRTLAAKISTRWTLRLMMLLASLAFFACAWPLSFVWFFAWRLLSGAAGGALMVLAAPTVLAHVPPSRRGLAGGVIFMGVGVGIAASGTLVPLLLQQGLAQTWLGLGVIALLLSAIAWHGWPTDNAPATGTPHPRRTPSNGTLKALYVEYALNAAGWVPHMIFLVDFVARGLGQGLQTGAQYWVLFGIGATVGPLLAGVLADRVGFGRALRVAFLIEAVSVAVPAMGAGTVWLMASSVVVGAFVTGTVPLVLGRIQEILVHHLAQQNAAWQTATVGFALFQAIAAYGLSFLFSWSGGNYHLLFLIGTSAMLIAFFIDVMAALRGSQPSGQSAL
ncbi:YbfB/YjiJ family MFS transporter [Pseudomonas sp. NPDC089569]|uniref:YbfB/YjiJ family MFS transporter n=1 Tax=Pseudomonas sp. NPDC089569 TaxID=3390722 RepID=UPI003D0917BE